MGSSVIFELIQNKKKFRAKNVNINIEEYYPESPCCFPVFRCNQSNLKKRCDICLYYYQLDDEVMVLPCAHLYHKECILPWFEEHTTCPDCKSKWLKTRNEDSLEDITQRLGQCSV